MTTITNNTDNDNENDNDNIHDDQQQPSSNKRCHDSDEISASKRIKTESESVVPTLPKSQPDDENHDDENHDDENHDAPKRWRAHQMVEDYVTAVGKLVLSGGGGTPPFSSTPTTTTTTALGYLTSPFRRGTIWENWSPKEVALFEASLLHYGKEFAQMKRACLPHKTTKDVVAFYYVWKKTTHYQKWKDQYEPDEGAWIMDNKATTNRKNKATATTTTTTTSSSSNGGSGGVASTRTAAAAATATK